MSTKRSSNEFLLLEPQSSTDSQFFSLGEVFSNPISVVLLILIGLVPLTWFFHGTPILGVDSYFQLHPQQIPDIFNSWSAATSPGNPQVDNAAWLELAQEWLGRTLPVWVEQALILCVFAGTSVFGFFALAKTFAEKVMLLILPLRDKLPLVEIEIASVAVAALWIANPFTDSFNWWHITLIQATWAEMPWIAYVILRIGTLRLPLALFLGIFLGGLGRLTMTEPYLPQMAVIVLVLAISSLTLDVASVKTIRKLATFLFGLAFGVVSWLLPAFPILRIVTESAIHFGGALSGGVQQAVSVTTSSATPLNVVSLTAWFTLHGSDFGIPYHQWSWLVQSQSWNWVRLLLPTWASIGAFWLWAEIFNSPKKTKRIANKLSVMGGVLGVTILLAVFLASASHGPFPNILKFVLRLPFGSAFRNPIDRTAAMIALPELLLVLISFVAFSVWTRSRRLVGMAVIAVTCLSLGFPYFANLTLPAGSGPVPGALAALPSQYSKVGMTLGSLPIGGKTMVLPFSTTGNVALRWRQGVQSNTNCILQDWAPLRSTLCTVSGESSADVVGEDLSRATASGADFVALARVFGVDSWLVHNDFNQVFSEGSNSTANSPSTLEMGLASFASTGNAKANGSSGGAVVISDNRHRADYFATLTRLPASHNLVLGRWGKLTIGAGFPESGTAQGDFFIWIRAPGGFYWPSQSLTAFRSELDISLVAGKHSSDFNINGVPQYVNGTKSTFNACGAKPDQLTNPGSLSCSTNIFSLNRGQATLRLPRNEALLKTACVFIRGKVCPRASSALGLHQLESGPYLSLWRQQSLPLIFVSTDVSYIPSSSYTGLLNWAKSVQYKKNPVLLNFHRRVTGTGAIHSFSRLSSTNYRLKLESNGTVVVAFLNTFNRGWHLVSSNSSIHVGRHFMVNGYANGWTISGRGSANMVLVYAPEASFSKLEFASMLLTFTSGCGALLVMLADRRRPLRRSGRNYHA